MSHIRINTHCLQPHAELALKLNQSFKYSNAEIDFQDQGSKNHMNSIAKLEKALRCVIDLCCNFPGRQFSKKLDKQAAPQLPFQ